MIQGNKCKKSLEGITNSMKRRATSGIEETVEDILAPMFDKYKEIKGVKTKDIKAHVKKSMQESKEELFQSIRKRQEKIEDEIKVNL